MGLLGAADIDGYQEKKDRRASAHRNGPDVCRN